MSRHRSNWELVESISVATFGVHDCRLSTVDCRVVIVC